MYLKPEWRKCSGIGSGEPSLLCTEISFIESNTLTQSELMCIGILKKAVSFKFE